MLNEQRNQMKHNEMYSLIDIGLREGKSKAYIFSELGGTDDLATAVAATPYFKDRQKYSKLNWLLVVIVVYFAVINLTISAINIYMKSLSYFSPFISALLFTPAAAIWIAIQLSKYRGHFYLITGLLGLGVIINGIKPEPANNPLLWGALQLPFAVGVLLAFFLKKKLCPQLGFMGAKTDSAGKYLFLSDDSVQPSAADGLR